MRQHEIERICTQIASLCSGYDVKDLVFDRHPGHVNVTVKLATDPVYVVRMTVPAVSSSDGVIPTSNITATGAAIHGHVLVNARELLAMVLSKYATPVAATQPEKTGDNLCQSPPKAPDEGETLVLTPPKDPVHGVLGGTQDAAAEDKAVISMLLARVDASPENETPDERDSAD